MPVQKALLLLVIIFVLQLAVSCNDCVCPGAEKYEVRYNDIAVTPYNTAGFVDRVVLEDTVYKNSFGLTVQLSSELSKISQLSDPIRFGFNVALACSCVGDEYVYTDSLERTTILMTDVSTNETQEVTEWFVTYRDDSNEPISLEEFFVTRANWHDGFQFELSEYSAVPRTAVFVVEALLKSGNLLIAQTDPVHFYD